MTAKQQAFVLEYLVDLNGTQAAIRAGYSAKSAYSIAEELLRKPEIAAATAEAKAERAAHVGVTAEDVITGLMKEAAFYGDGSSHSARVSAWGLLGKHLGMMVDRTEVTLNAVVDMGGEGART